MAGAMLPTSAGLKSISFKHLALSSQCLGVLLALLPHLKAILTAYLSESQRPLLKQLDGAASDLEVSRHMHIFRERERDALASEGDSHGLSFGIATATAQTTRWGSLRP